MELDGAGGVLFRGEKVCVQERDGVNFSLDWVRVWRVVTDLCDWRIEFGCRI